MPTANTALRKTERDQGSARPSRKCHMTAPVPVRTTNSTAVSTHQLPRRESRTLTPCSGLIEPADIGSPLCQDATFSGGVACVVGPESG